jgi:hypothetical protein
MKGTPNMKSFMILVTVAIFGQIVAFIIAAHFSDLFSEDPETLVPEQTVGPLAPSSTLNISSIPNVYGSANRFHYEKI